MTYLKVFVTPGARREKVEEKNDPSRRGEDEAGMLIISIKEPAARNRANTRVREIIAERYKKSLGDVRILTGHHSRAKMISVID